MWSGKGGHLGIIPGEFNTEDEEEEENTIGRNRTGNCHSGETGIQNNRDSQRSVLW